MWICLKLRMSYDMHHNYLPFARLQLTRGSSCFLESGLRELVYKKIEPVDS